jgi:hypothetical protein
MIAKTCTCSLLGIDAILVEVEVDIASGLPGLSIVRGYLTYTPRRHPMRTRHRAFEHCRAESL